MNQVHAHPCVRIKRIKSCITISSCSHTSAFVWSATMSAAAYMHV